MSSKRHPAEVVDVQHSMLGARSGAVNFNVVLETLRLEIWGMVVASALTDGPQGARFVESGVVLLLRESVVMDYNLSRFTHCLRALLASPLVSGLIDSSRH